MMELPPSPSHPPTQPSPPPTLTEPLPPLLHQRIEALDVLRGIAVLGILPVNIVSFAGPEAWMYAPMDVPVYSGLDRVMHAMIDVFFSFKFITLFSLLFGAGVLIQAQRNAARGGAVYAIHYRRMAALAVIGVAHAWLIWYGDILFTYAVCGCLVVLMRRWSPRALLTAAGVAFGVCVLSTATCGGFMLLFQRFSPGEYAQMMGQILSIDAEVAAYTGGYVGQLTHRIPSALGIQFFMLPYWSLWWAGGLMLLGMAYCKLGWITAEAEPARYRRIALVTLPIGLLLTLLIVGGLWTDVVTPTAMFTWALVPMGVAALLMSTGYLALVMLWVRGERGRWLRHVLACVGRTALTCYLMQSVICGLVFYGHGLGLFAQLGRTAQLGVVACVWAVQLAAAPLWLRAFPQGPMEWLWRRVTYWGPPRGVTPAA